MSTRPLSDTAHYANILEDFGRGEGAMDQVHHDLLQWLCRRILGHHLTDTAREILQKLSEAPLETFRQSRSRLDGGPGEHPSVQGFLNSVVVKDTWAMAIHQAGEFLGEDLRYPVLARIYSLPEDSTSVQIAWDLQEDTQRTREADMWLEVCWQAGQRGLTPSTWLQHHFTTAHFRGSSSEIFRGIGQAYEENLTGEAQEIYYTLLTEGAEVEDALEAAYSLSGHSSRH